MKVILLLIFELLLMKGFTQGIDLSIKNDTGVVYLNEYGVLSNVNFRQDSTWFNIFEEEYRKLTTVYIPLQRKPIEDYYISINGNDRTGDVVYLPLETSKFIWSDKYNQFIYNRSGMKLDMSGRILEVTH